ncbi:MAG: SRPBCC family protein [Bacteroidetes bacterium]|nr:SRPBCC family protein [Bacteroidota bacterium]
MRITTEINAPAEKVFRLLTQKENFKDWWRGFISLDYKNEPDQQNPVGTKFHVVYRAGFRRDKVSFDCEITTYKKNEQYSFTASNRFGNSDASYRLTSVNGKTILEFEANYVPPKILVPFVIMAKWDLKFHTKRNLNRLKLLAEKN